MIVLKCEICGKEACGVASSSMGPISHAYCRECLQLGREVYGTMVGGLYGCLPHDNPTGAGLKAAVHEGLHETIEATLTFYTKTWDDLAADIRSLEEDYDRYFKEQDKTLHIPS